MISQRREVVVVWKLQLIFCDTAHQIFAGLFFKMESFRRMMSVIVSNILALIHYSGPNDISVEHKRVQRKYACFLLLLLLACARTTLNYLIGVNTHLVPATVISFIAFYCLLRGILKWM
jgi:hypothetical protein